MTSYPDNPLRGLGPVGPGVNTLLTMGLKLQLRCERSPTDGRDHQGWWVAGGRVTLKVLGLSSRSRRLQLLEIIGFKSLCWWRMSCSECSGRMDGAAADCTGNGWNRGSRPTESSNGFYFYLLAISLFRQNDTMKWSDCCQNLRENIRESKTLQTSKDKNQVLVDLVGIT